MSRKFKLEIECDNAAFENDDCHEIARILRVTSREVGYGREVGDLFDLNGNRVGWFALEGPERDDE